MGSFRKGFGFAFGILMGGFAFFAFLFFTIVAVATCNKSDAQPRQKVEHTR